MTEKENTFELEYDQPACEI